MYLCLLLYELEIWFLVIGLKYVFSEVSKLLLGYG